jgi:hypothetical protein
MITINTTNEHISDFIAIDFETANQQPVQLSPYTYYKSVATYHILMWQSGKGIKFLLHYKSVSYKVS